MKIYRYRIVVRIPHDSEDDYSVSGSLIYEKGCKCELIGDLQLYKGASCKEEITPGVIMTYGEDLCIRCFR